MATRVGGNRQSSLALTCGMHMKNAGTNHASANKATIRSESVVKDSVEECRGTGYHNGKFPKSGAAQHCNIFSRSRLVMCIRVATQPKNRLAYVMSRPLSSNFVQRSASIWMMSGILFPIHFDT